jgi:hypothetical protein
VGYSSSGLVSRRSDLGLQPLQRGVSIHPRGATVAAQRIADALDGLLVAVEGIGVAAQCRRPVTRSVSRQHSIVVCQYRAPDSENRDRPPVAGAGGT